MMRFRRHIRPYPEPSKWWRRLGRGTLVALGVAVVAAALAGAVTPYQQIRELSRAVDCEQESTDCVVNEAGSVHDRRTFTTTSTSTSADGHSTTTTTTHYEVTWEHPDGTRQSREVSRRFYRHVEVGQPATLRTWRGDVVGIEVAGEPQWFLPTYGYILQIWLHLAWLGVGVALWGRYGWWDGFFMLTFRGISWMFLALVPIRFTTDTLAFGLETGVGLLLTIATGLFFVGVAGWMVVHSLDRW